MGYQPKKYIAAPGILPSAMGRTADGSNDFLEKGYSEYSSLPHPESIAGSIRALQRNMRGRAPRIAETLQAQALAETAERQIDPTLERLRALPKDMHGELWRQNSDSYRIIFHLPTPLKTQTTQPDGMNEFPTRAAVSKLANGLGVIAASEQSMLMDDARKILVMEAYRASPFIQLVRGHYSDKLWNSRRIAIANTMLDQAADGLDMHDVVGDAIARHGDHAVLEDMSLIRRAIQEARPKHIAALAEYFPTEEMADRIRHSAAYIDDPMTMAKTLMRARLVQDIAQNPLTRAIAKAVPDKERFWREHKESLVTYIEKSKPDPVASWKPSRAPQLAALTRAVDRWAQNRPDSNLPLRALESLLSGSRYEQALTTLIGADSASLSAIAHMFPEKPIDAQAYKLDFFNGLLETAEGEVIKQNGTNPHPQDVADFRAFQTVKKAFEEASAPAGSWTEKVERSNRFTNSTAKHNTGRF